MRVFDFDNTIYDGESSIDFFKFVLKKYPFVIFRYVPKFLQGVKEYKSGKMTVQDAIRKYSDILADALKRMPNINKDITDFWDKNEHKIKQFYKDIYNEEDIILSASPESSLNEIGKRLGIKHIIGSQIDIETGKIQSFCFKEYKIKRFKEIYGDCTIDEFYTDSMNDKPFMDISNTVYFVTGDKIEKIKENGEYK